MKRLLHATLTEMVRLKHIEPLIKVLIAHGEIVSERSEPLWVKLGCIELWPTAVGLNHELSDTYMFHDHALTEQHLYIINEIRKREHREKCFV